LHHIVFILAIFCMCLQLRAQVDTTTWLEVTNIDVIGHARTRKSFILREINLRVGDKISISDLQRVLDYNELRLLNTKVFNWVEITADQYHKGDRVSICIDGSEPNYFSFVPLIELADRNFNVWIRDYNASLRRVNLGGYLKHNNVLGMGDPIRLLVQFGYTNKFELVYGLPFANRAKTIGFEVQALFSRSKEVNYASRENRQLFFFDPDEFQYFRRRFTLQMRYKPRNLNAFLLRTEFHLNSISDTVAQHLNTEFFGDGKRQQKYTVFAVSYEHDERDIRPYPLQGKLFRAEFKQSGIPELEQFNLTQLSTTFRRYRSFRPNLSYEADFSGRITMFRKRPPFVNYRALGYFEHFVRGYEFYVMDGLDYALLKQSMRYRIWKKPIFIPAQVMPIRGLRAHPLRTYLSANFDLGFVNDPYLRTAHPLNNRPLMGYGISFDFVYRYGTVVKLELSRNDLGETGYFLHIGSKR
jgi:outer membrane protein assembly factor BamA